MAELPSSPQPFVPKQAVPYSPDVLCELCHPATAKIAEHFFSELVKNQSKPMSQWKLHDNACGYGEVSRVLLERQPPPAESIEIVGTDYSVAMVQSFLKLKDAHPLANVRAEKQNSQDLKFPDNWFTHSISNFLIHPGPDPSVNVQIVKEIYRTLVPGGTAVITNWNQLGHGGAVTAAHEGTRGEDAPPLLIGMGKEFWRPSYLISCVEEGGFDREKMTILSRETSAGKSWASEASRRRYVGLMWSVLGATMQGWRPLDEERWDQALNMLEEVLPTLPGVTLSPDGVLSISLTGTIIIVRK